MKVNENFKVGRPSQGKKKKITRAVTSDEEIEKFLYEHREINASELFRNMIHSMMPKDPDEIKLNNLIKRKNELEQELASITPEIERLKSKINEKEKLKVETKIESDFEAWYLRFLVQSGVFSIKTIPEQNPWDLYRYIKEKPDFNENEIEIRNNELYLTDKASLLTLRKFHDFRKGNHLVKIPEKKILTPMKEALQMKYHITLNDNEFENEFLTGGISGDLPVEFFKRFEPKIFSIELKEEIKRMMTPEYSKIDIEVKS